MNAPLMAAIQAAIQISHSGLRDEARAAFDKLVPQLGEDALANCIFSHFMADVQTEVKDELAWDLRSLEYLQRLTDGQLQSFHESLTTATDKWCAAAFRDYAPGFRDLASISLPFPGWYSSSVKR